MGFIVFFLLPLGIISSFIFSIFCFKKFYFILDTVIIGIFLITGTIDSQKSQWEINALCLNYMMLKSVFLFLLFIWKKIMMTTIVFGTRSILQKYLIIFNIILNFILFFPTMTRFFSLAFA